MVLHYKKPAFWIVCAGVACAIVISVCFATNPRVKALEEQKENETMVAETAVEQTASGNGDAPYTLVPAYVAWCEYCNDEAEEPLASKDEGADIFLGNPQNFQPIIVNAQTGKIHDNQSMDYSLAVAPAIIR